MGGRKVKLKKEGSIPRGWGGKGLLLPTLGSAKGDPTSGKGELSARLNETKEEGGISPHYWLQGSPAMGKTAGGELRSASK